MPGGTLVDAHPVSEERVETRGGVVGTIREPSWLAVDLPGAEAGLRRVVDDGLYVLEAETTYEVLQHFDEAVELIEAKQDVLEGQAALVAAIRAAEPPLRTRTRIVARRLRSVGEGVEEELLDVVTPDEGRPRRG